MNVLIACEFSGIVRDAFIEQGHDAMSCDLLPTEKLGSHYQGNVFDIINDGWDLMIAHPPCTYLCRNRAQLNKIENVQEQQIDARNFFLELWNSDIKRICIENPIPSKESRLPKYSQIIQPYQFGHDYSKKTCLWLKGLPKLQSTKTVNLSYIITPNGVRYTKGWYEMPRNSIDRSRTFYGIAKAMSIQYGKEKFNLEKFFRND